MPRRAVKSIRSSRPAAKRSEQDSKALRTIADSEATQQRGVLPTVRDIEPITVARDKVYTFSRSLSVGTITPSATLDTFGAANFTLASLPDSTEFTTLFDQYRLLQVVVRFVPLTTGPYMSPLFTVIDYDDSTTPTGIASLLEYMTLETTQSGSFCIRAFNPRFATAAYSGVFTSFAQSRGWVDVASPSVQYYGIKWGVPANPGGTTTAVYAIYADVVVQCRNAR